MHIRVKLRREWQGQDSWGAFLEEVGLDENGEIRYRKSDGGNCHFGNWEEWQHESAALEFMLGPIDVIPTMRAHVYVALSLLPDLKEVELNRHGVLDGAEGINYGRY
jgi:hypothetical protein